MEFGVWFPWIFPRNPESKPNSSKGLLLLVVVVVVVGTLVVSRSDLRGRRAIAAALPCSKSLCRSSGVRLPPMNMNRVNRTKTTELRKRRVKLMVIRRNRIGLDLFNYGTSRWILGRKRVIRR